MGPHGVASPVPLVKCERIGAPGVVPPQPLVDDLGGVETADGLAIFGAETLGVAAERDLVGNTTSVGGEYVTLSLVSAFHFGKVESYVVDCGLTYTVFFVVLESFVDLLFDLVGKWKFAEWLEFVVITPLVGLCHDLKMYEEEEEDRES